MVRTMTAHEGPASVWAVCGGSGSGKSTLVTLLRERLPEGTLAVLHADAYYRDLSHLPPEVRAVANFDHPDSVEEELLVAHVDALRRGAAVDMPRYDFANHARLPEADRVEPAPVVLVEGILLFAFPDLAERFDWSVFLDVPEDVRLTRRIQRDVLTRGRSEESVRSQFAATVAPMHWEYVQPVAERADRVVTLDEDLAVVADGMAERIRALLP